MIKKIMILIFWVVSFSPTVWATPLGAAGTVVKLYCTLDALGAGLSSTTVVYQLPLVTWTDGPGWDEITNISQFEIINEKYKGDQATVEVKYQVVGKNVSQEVGTKFIPGRRTETVTYNLLLKGSDWKIESPQLAPHVYLKH